MSDLTPRQRKRVDALKAQYRKADTFKDQESAAFFKGAAWGYKVAMRRMYPDAETFMAEDKQAADMVLGAVALEELASGE